jgi:hypothetical protein
MRPEEDRDELLFRADVNFFFALALDGNGLEERALRKDLLFRAEKNFFFAQGLEEKEAPSPPPEEEPAYPSQPDSPDAESSTMSKEEEPASEPEANEDAPGNVSAAREKIRRMAASALSYEEQWTSAPKRPPRASPPSRTERDLVASGDGAPDRHWWEKSVSTAPRQPCIKYPPSFGNMNI